LISTAGRATLAAKACRNHATGSKAFGLWYCAPIGRYGTGGGVVDFEGKLAMKWLDFGRTKINLARVDYVSDEGLPPGTDLQGGVRVYFSGGNYTDVDAKDKPALFAAIAAQP
jgi:hypothetical protein